jgi:hypothetical protein
VRGHFLAIAGAVALAASLPASGAPNAVEHFNVVSAKAAATLSFQSASSDQSAQTNGTVTLTASKKGSGKGSLPGRALAALKGTLKERVKTKRTPSDSSPYQETCANSHKVGGKGGVTLRRVGGKVEARWAFPQAKTSFCRGPKVGKSTTAKMKRMYSASTFERNRVTIVLAGKSTSHSGSTTLTYRWSAKVILARS